ncbi:MAG TPA: ABC transporter ATP-binding protein [Acidimicrobiales bacterium]|nr:ABC transporter ATP-binding protein [Acidimicrobiales bacterium]
MTELDGGAAASTVGAPGASGVGSAAPAIELRGIVKRFPGVVANDGVDLAVAASSIHAVVGENGAGKSTLMKVLYGEQRPDEGSILVRGAEQSFKSPRDAIAVGIGMVHQHFMLADNLTVAENVILGDEPGSALRIDFREASDRIEELGRVYGLAVDPHALVADLGVGDRQRVEIMKVLYRGARILILDEPTTVLVPQEVDQLFVSLRELTTEGVTIIFISHKLDEVLAVADAITVMRAGRTVASVLPSEVTARDLAELMVGSELPKPEKRESTVTDQTELEVNGLTVIEEVRAVLDHVSFTVHRGEVVGVAGVEGNGQRELVEALVGLRQATSGRITLAGIDISHESTRFRREHGIGYIPEDRQHDGLLLSSTLWENSMLGHQTRPPYARGPWTDRGGARERTAQIVAEFDVRTPSVDVAAYALSGGNQQKLVVGREMLGDPRVLIASHPTRGIDVGAQAAVWESIRQARSLGLAVLLISADLEELIGLSDTLLVILRGRIVATLDPGTVTPVELGSYMTGAKEGTAA